VSTNNLTSSNGRIPADKTRGFTAWAPPALEHGNIVDVVRQEHRERGGSGELIDLSKEAVLYNSLTAGQLHDITEKAYDEGRQRGYETGLQEGQKVGYEKGMAQALAEGERHVRDQLTQLRQVLERLMQPYQDQQTAIEQALYVLATDMARTIIGRELQMDSSAIEQVIHEAVAALPVGYKRLRVHLHPKDLALMQEKSQLPDEWQLWEDATLQPGGCRVTTEHSSIDFSVEERFRQLLATQNSATSSTSLTDPE
jgi:flagellar assembly protein FliH